MWTSRGLSHGHLHHRLVGPGHRVSKVDFCWHSEHIYPAGELPTCAKQI